MTPLRAALIPESDRLARLRLIRSDNVGPATYRDLIAHFGTAEAALDGLPDLAKRGGRNIRIASAADAERELAAATRAGARIVAIEENDYPPWLRSIEAPPPLVTVRGSAEAITAPAVAIVGSRNASIVGRKFAGQLARDLGAAGYTIVSGLARGIDAAAHGAALETGTVAVFAGGLERPYPPDNIPLADDIIARGGAHISEMPLGWEPRARDFPRRNRLISGMSAAVIVVEAAMRSGSLITARLATQQGRLVFAVPGSPLDPRAGGTNHLIREGATLVTHASDVLEDIRPMMAREPERPPVRVPASFSDHHPAEAGESDRTRILDALGPAPVHMDDIIAHTSLPASVVRVVLLEVDLAGKLAHHPGGMVSLVP